MKLYDNKAIEKKWQKDWEKKKLYSAKDFSKKPKFYGLIEFPYPSGEGLHVGHIRSNTAMDIISRKKRMEGYNVLYPIGWDAFGLPTENYAIKTGIHPIKVTKKNTDTFRKQLKAGGFSFDWAREINTSDPKYYRWTQWIFLKLFEKGLAYKAKMPINWCLSCKIGLANEEVIDGKCERCGGPTEKREKEQWMLAITKYADRLDKDLDTVNYLEKIKIQQRNWIGKSEGAEIEFRIADSESRIKVFTTRADTLFGVTYLVLSPENKLVQSLKSQISNWEEVARYVAQVKKKTEIERTDIKKEKTGVELEGVFAINPVNKEKVPVWVADYVLASYGTGAVMAVPAHDERDWDFAKKYKLTVRQVIAEHLIDSQNPLRADKPTVKRRVIQGIIKHWKEDKILALKWKNQSWTTFVIGGAENNETGEEAVRREILEETGFKNFKIVRQLGGKIISEFYAAHKAENRYADMELYLVQLEDGEQKELSSEEQAKHEITWIPTDRILSDINPCNEKGIVYDRLKNGEHSYTGDGVIINSGKFDGAKNKEAKSLITKFVSGEPKTTYKLRDWVFSRQRYWGEPIPIIHCDKCGIVPVPEKDLPVKLPNVKNYKPTDTGESPLASIDKWVNVKCPKCGGKARRETDTMPNWAGSSWYYLRYIDPKNSKEFAARKKLDYWKQVDWYNGGMEHTTLHLLYSRFWHKFLFDLGVVPTSEPYAKRTSHGLILAEGGVKMSKSKGNVMNPDEIVKTYGADTLRVYEMFMGPFDQAVAWSTESIIGPRRFLERVWNILPKVSKKELPLSASTHTLIKKVGSDIEGMKFNTGVSTMMVFTNELDHNTEVSKSDYETLLKVLAPFAPHITEELWSMLGHKKSIHVEPWPAYDEKMLVGNSATIAVQVNGKLRATFEAAFSVSEEEVKNKAISLVEKWIPGKQVKKTIYIPGRLINFVV